MESKKIELAEKVLGLINEFIELESLICESTYKGIKIDKVTAKIIIEDEYEGTLEYDVVEVARLFHERVNGWGPCSSGFYEAIEEEKNCIEDKFEELDKEEFINYIGRLYYMEYRCEKIIKELKDLSVEYQNI